MPMNYRIKTPFLIIPVQIEVRTPVLKLFPVDRLLASHWLSYFASCEHTTICRLS
ncbi:hypothetical protein PHET_00009 [Paragonimus heterotremus]|uniref:Uncharacterized protein n=1 Tax=Paragonimus heterotremus TaxID=100268 RepID=A0A8J4WLF2_9TREM|nr:hypothetical protein PHET_00009 [Paragonimus heterotremus]